MEKTQGQLAHGRFSISYRVYGDSPHAVVCVNGAQQSMASWRTVVRTLRGEMKVVTFDFPGQGKSTSLDGEAVLSFADQVDIVHAVARAAGAIPAAVFGASWGGLIAAGYAARHAAGVTRLLLAGLGLRHTPRLRSLIARGQQLVREGRYAELGPMMIDGFGASLPSVWKRMIASQFDALTAAQAQAFLAHSRLVEDIRDVRELIDFSAITAETLIINGADDQLIDPEDMTTASRLIRSCAARRVAGVGHFLHLESPAVLEHYRAFLTGSAAAAPAWGELRIPHEGVPEAL